MAIVVTTQERAIAVLTTHWSACQDALGLVAALEELGLLYIDRRETLDQKLDKAIGFLGPSATHAELKYALDAQGLMIIEK